MSRLRCASLAGAVALFVLVGRWGIYRLTSPEAEPNPLTELRLWAVLAVLLLAAIGLADRTSHVPGESETRKDAGLSTALLLFLGYMGFSALWAPDAAASLTKLYELALVGVMSAAFAFAALRLPPGRLLDCFWGVVVLVCGVLALVGVRQLLSSGAGRLSVLGGGPNVFARLMGLLMLGSLYLWYHHGRAWLWLPLGGMGLVLILLSGSRGGTAAGIAALAAFLFVQRPPLRRLAVLTVLGVLLGGVGLKLTPLARPLERSMEERFVRLTLHYSGRDDEEGRRGERGSVYLSGRTGLYASALALGKDHPVAGAGLAAFPALGLGVYPHNLFLEVFCEGGALGLALLAALLLTFAASAWKRRATLDGACLGGVVMVLVGSQASGDLYDTRTLFLLMLLASCTAPAAFPAAEPERELPPGLGAANAPLQGGA